MKQFKFSNFSIWAISFLFLFTGLVELDAQPISKKIQVPKQYRQKELRATSQIKSQLRTLRREISRQNYNFEVGYTSVLNKPLSKLTGDGQVTPAQSRQIKSKMAVLRSVKPYYLENFRLAFNCESSGPASWDSRDFGWITSVKDQSDPVSCGSCWAFAAVAMFEANYLKVNGRRARIDASEQHPLSCSGGGNCNDGGLSWQVFDWLVNPDQKLKSESSFAYSASDESCVNSSSGQIYDASYWETVRPDGDITKIANANDIKRYIKCYGAVKTSLVATSIWSAYTGGILDGSPSNTASPTSNHAVLIVGWDDELGAWLIKNSWGTDWGINGYCWVKYGNFNVGRRACVIAANKQNKIIDLSRFQNLTVLNYGIKPQVNPQVRPQLNPRTNVGNLKVDPNILRGNQAKEDCVSFRYRSLRIKRKGKSYGLYYGRKLIGTFPNKTEATKALAILKKYRATDICSIGDFSYLKSGRSVPRGSYRGEDCIGLNPKSIKVVSYGKKYAIQDGRSRKFIFPTQAEANAVLAIIKKNGFTKTCYVGRPGPSLTYMRK